MSLFTSLPSEEIVKKAAELKVFDSNSEAVTFGSLFLDQKAVVVFIRHFGCGSCQGFVTALSQVPKDRLDKAGARLVVIGCGKPDAIDTYKEITGYQGELYADPTRELYHALGITTQTTEGTPDDEPRRNYLLGSKRYIYWISLWRGLVRYPSLLLKAGNFSQLGGDFIFGPGYQCTFSSRMKHTEDHIEVSDLMKEAGVDLNT